MDSQECHRWTFSGLIAAFLELALAYCLLSASAFMFLASKFLLVFGLFLPCPCTGILWYQNRDMCLHKLLFDWPLRKIYTIQKLARYRLPFHIVWHEDEDQNPSSMVFCTEGKDENDVLKLEYRTGSSSFLGLRMKNLEDKENDLDVKGKKTTNKKPKVYSRRRRRKSSLVFLNTNVQSAFAGVSGSSDITRVVKGETSENPDDNVTQDEFDLQDTTSCFRDIENVSDGETDEKKEGSSSVKSLMHNDVDMIKMLEQGLREERAAHMALTLELEKERAAAATAADEALAMILRLQADKASLEMEAKQYERMIEEKFAYDEEEMNILKEILVRQEKENHFLEKELEAYTQIDVSDNELLEDGFNKHDDPHGHGAVETIASAEGRGLAQNDLSTTQTAQTGHAVGTNLSFYNGVVEINREPGVKTNNHEDCSSPDREPIVYDVHVIEDNTEFHEKGKMREKVGRCTEIEWLGERLRNILKEKEGLANSTEYKERVTAQMKLVEEIVNQLQEMEQLNEPAVQ